MKRIYIFILFLISLLGITFYQCSKDKIIVLSDEREILSFSLQNVASTVLWEGQTLYILSYDTIDLSKPFTPLITVSEDATVYPPSGMPQIFSETGVKYTVTSQNGKTKEFFVKIRVLKSNNQILDFILQGINSNADIRDSAIYVTVYDNVDLTSIYPVIVCSEEAQIYPPATVPQNFNLTVVYEVTAPNGNKRKYEVVTEKRLNEENDILSFDFPNVKCKTIIADSVVFVEMYEKLDLTKLTPSITISDMATMYPQSGVTQDFTIDVFYEVTAQNGELKKYKVVVTEALNEPNNIILFSFPNLDHKAIIRNDTIWVELYDDIALNNLAPIIEISDKATVTPKSGEVQNFENDVIYTVTSESGLERNYVIRVYKVLDSDKELLSFSIPNMLSNVVFNGNNIEIELFENVDITRLTPIITVSSQANVSPRSGETVDFTNPVNYTVIAKDGSMAIYSVTVNKNLNSDKRIISFTIPNKTSNVIYNGNNINIEVLDDIDVTKLTPIIEISSQASVSPRSGETVDFTSPVNYTVTAKDGTTALYIVTVTKNLDSDKEILSFTIPNRTSKVVFNGNNIDVEVLANVDVSSLTPILTCSPKATVSPKLGETLNFSNPVIYTVIAQDGSTAKYTVTVTKNLSSEKEILSFTVPNRTNNVTFNGNNIDVEVYAFVDVSSLAPILTCSPRATVLPRSGETVNFSNPVNYKVTAQDGSIATYTVTVTKSLSRRNEIEKFELIGTEQIFEREDDYIYIYVPYETDITNIKTDIVVSDMATVSPASGTYRNFTNPQIYTVTASDGASKNYLVTVKRSSWRNVIKNGEAPFAARDQLELLVYKDKLWLLGGWLGGQLHSNEVWNTEDGKNWNSVTANANWGTRNVSKFIVFKNKLWVIGGYSDHDMGIYNSDDGVNWIKQLDLVPWEKRYESILVEFKGKLWLMGGIKDTYAPVGFNDIWSSEDGINWIREIQYASWQERGAIHGSVVLNGALYIIGGGIIGEQSSTNYELLTEYNDVWKTTDGINWQRILRNAPWPPRLYHSIVAYNGVMYVIAGSVGKGATLSNEVWKSTDGISWEQVKHSFWSPRHATSVIGYKGKLWMACGFFVNDVWCMEL